MKILFITNIPSPYRVKFFSLLGNKCDLTVIYELNKASGRDDNWALRLHDKPYREIWLKTFQTLDDGGISLNIIQYLSDEYDFIVIGTHGTPTAKIAIAYMRMKRIPFVLNIDGMISEDVNRYSWLNKKLRKILFAGAKAYITTGDDSIEYFYKLSKEFLRESFYKYHFSSTVESDVCKCSKSQRMELRRKYNLTEKYYIISVGRFIPSKGMEILIYMLNKLYKNIGLILVGGDKKCYAEQIDKLSDDVKKRIVFPGFLTRKALKEYYLMSDLFVLMTKHDTWGLVINEAMACGLPIITTTKCGAGLELIKNGENGFLVNDGDENITVEYIKKILADDSLRENMSKKNITLAYEYTIEQMVRDHIRIFNEL